MKVSVEMNCGETFSILLEEKPCGLLWQIIEEEDISVVSNAKGSFIPKDNSIESSGHTPLPSQD